MVYKLQRDGQTYGPYTLEDLQRYVTSGNVQPTDMVQSDTATDWMTVAQLLGMDGAPPPPPVFQPGFSSVPAWQAQHGPFYGAAPIPTRELYRWFPVSLTKYLVMHVSTLGLYQLFWIYKQWTRIKAIDRDDLWPWARTLFAGIWNFPLFDRVSREALEADVRANWNPYVLGFGAMLFGVFAWFARGPWQALVLLSFLPYLPVIVTIEKLNRQVAADTAEPPNDRFSTVNIVFIVIGSIFVLLALLGWFAEAAGLVPSK